VRLVDARGNAYKLNRLLKADDDGIMCIGKTGTMKTRRKQILSGVERGRGHSEMNLVYFLKNYSTEYLNKFQNARFQYSMHVCATEEESKQEEERLIKLYFLKFGEVPPLNSAIPNRIGEWPIR